MTNQDSIGKLLNCVEIKWQSLDQVATITIGEFVHKNNQNPAGKYPVYNGGKSPTGYYDKFNNTGDKIIVSARGANAGFVNRLSGPYWAGNSCYSIGVNDHTKLNWNFVYFFLKNSENNLIGNQQKGGIPAVSKTQIEKFQIPIPCPENPEESLKIQNEIVRILDIFTKLTAELTNDLTGELTNRKKQYAYYLDQLLSFGKNEVERKALGDVTLPTKNIKWNETNRSYHYIDLTSVCREKNKIIKTTKISNSNAPSRAQKLVLKDDIIFATTRPTQQRICLITEEYSGEIASTGYCILRPLVDKVLPKWIYFCLSSNEFKIYVEKKQSGAAYPAISDTKVKEFKIPIPPIENQARIVNILDKFDALNNSISEGLTKEIELRQKQYKYYRELLFSFSKQGL